MSNAENTRIRKRLFTSTITTVASISLVLFMLGFIGLLVLNARKISHYVKENLSITLMLKDAATTRQIEQLQRRIEQSPYAKRVVFVSSEEAAATMQQELGEDFLDILNYNPLSSSMEIYMQAAYAHPDSMQYIEAQLGKEQIVQEVFYQKSLARIMNDHIRRLSIVILGISAFFLFIAIILINNTIRLMIYSRRFVIYSMQLVGATNGFIRRPLVFKGVLQGVVASVLAMAALFALMYGVNTRVAVLFGMEDLHAIMWIFAGILVAGILLCMVCTHVSVNRFLRMSLDKLYY